MKNSGAARANRPVRKDSIAAENRTVPPRRGQTEAFPVECSLRPHRTLIDAQTVSTSKEAIRCKVRGGSGVLAVKVVPFVRSVANKISSLGQQ